MSLTSPGNERRDAWFANVLPKDVNLSMYMDHGLRTIPVALVPSSGGSLRLKNPKFLQEHLLRASAHFREISVVQQYGKNGLLCKSASLDCVSDLLACTVFANVPVEAFIPPHLACVKGVVRNVDSSLTPLEVLDLFSPAGVTSVYRCSKLVDGTRQATESVICSFAGLSRPSEVKAWPIIYRVDPFVRRPTQCRKCWRFGHMDKNCKSGVRCRMCGCAHSSVECSEQDPKCCVCGNKHVADSPDCPARAQEVEVITMMDRSHCSRVEAAVAVKQRTSSFSSVVSRATDLSESSISKMLDAAVEKAVARIVDPILQTLSSSISQIMADKLSEVMRSFRTAPPTFASVDESLSTVRPSQSVIELVSDEESERSLVNASAPSSSADQEESLMECCTSGLKRAGSPLSDTQGKVERHGKRKGKSNKATKKDILQEAVSAITSD